MSGRASSRRALCGSAALLRCDGGPRFTFGRSRAAATGSPRLTHGRALAEHESNRCPEEPELLAQPVFEVAPVGEVDRARVPREEHEGWRRNANLGCVEELRAPTLDHRRLLPSGSIAHEAVERTGRNPAAPLGPDVNGELEH